VEGDLVKDTVSLGGFQTTEQQWLLADRTTPSLLTGSNAGIMGLAFQAIANTKAVPFWQSLINANKLSSPEMSFWMTRLLDDASASEESFGGIFTLGGTNSSLFTGDIEFLDLTGGTTPQYWLLDVSKITVQGNTVSIPSGSVAAAIDTGTTLIGGPKAVVDAIYAAVPGAKALTGQLEGFYGFPCTTDVSVTISFGGKVWPISTADMNVGRATLSSTVCVGGIFDLNGGSTIEAGNGNPSWVVGGTFLKNVYSVFRSDPPSIGFAELSDATGGSSGTPGSGTGTGAGPSVTGSSGDSAMIPTPPPLILLTLVASILTLA
jgi:cathepsin D